MATLSSINHRTLPFGHLQSKLYTDFNKLQPVLMFRLQQVLICGGSKRQILA